MPPTARVVIATVLVVLATAHSYIFALSYGIKHHKHSALFTPFLADARAGRARSTHPELYTLGTRFGFIAINPRNADVRETVLYSLRNSLTPATVASDPAHELVIVYFESLADVPAFEADKQFRLLDQLSENTRVYRREGK